jgi:elongator complex protein 3
MRTKTTDKNVRSAIIDLLESRPSTIEELVVANRKVAKKHKVEVARNSDILLVYREEVKAKRMVEDKAFERLLRRRAVRTMSGIAPVAVLTKPFACPGKCAYCPTEKDVPQSYLSNEPAVMRAIRCEYHPYVQVADRLRSLENNGHDPTKIEIIVIGGTWSVLPAEYKYWYILNCFAAANQFKRKTQNAKRKGISQNTSLKKLKEMLSDEQKKNERAKYKIIGLTLETRPDYIDGKELLEMRELGCTRVELGVQAIDEDILKLNKRGHGVERIVQATGLLRDYGFKITYHLMPGLPGSTPKKDLAMFKQLFNDARFQPDQIKFYPTVVTKGSLLYKWWQQGKYRPYTDKQLQQLIIDCKKAIPPYVRIIRLIRDIPGESIIAGNTVTNLRQVMQQRGVECSCIRCREARDEKITDYGLRITDYPAASGQEYFIEYCSADKKTLYAFCRLYLAKDKNNLLGSAAVIRELHVYGELVSIGGDKKVQHAGLGRQLLAQAERMAKDNGFAKMAIISGIGVRGYYRKFGYRCKETYMVKSL